MLPAARKGDATSCGAICSGSLNVFINSIPGAVAGGSAASSSLVGMTSVVTGSGTVFINNLPVARAGDVAGDGAAIVCGSSNVFIGG
ncbi:PAAR domain-containing protein [Yersinia pekkanenii]|uniref:Rhs-family protein n=1 Tax=Yersinia pekkanenii TaxID=1288385 RepID=A0A0T9Q7C0_9GAMM|nr:PAAR domain-containing protein [Yersinia pekkanenii]CNH98998.1 Rhs-family protein [Yersinia pekkanenii]CRY65080.1 Rhs-family protein [Yersinia pekkanenii]